MITPEWLKQRCKQAMSCLDTSRDTYYVGFDCIQTEEEQNQRNVGGNDENVAKINKIINKTEKRGNFI